MAFDRKAYMKEYMPAYKKRKGTAWAECNRRYRNNLQRRLRLAAVAVLGGKCVRCGFSDERALQIDHVHGGGVKELKHVRSQRKYYKGVVASVEAEEGKYQLLCANCNWIKRAENDENTRRYPREGGE